MGLGRQGERERARGRERAWAGRSTSSFTCAGHHHGARGKDPHLHPPICTHKSSHTHSLALAHLPIAIAVSVAPDRGVSYRWCYCRCCCNQLQDGVQQVVLGGGPPNPPRRRRRHSTRRRRKTSAHRQPTQFPPPRVATSVVENFVLVNVL